MKYADIDIKTARKCCKQHSYKNKDGETITKCETCPLERTGTNKDKHLFCWFILKRFNDWERKNVKDNTPEQIYKCQMEEEYNALQQEEVSKILEWENWINSQDSLD